MGTCQSIGADEKSRSSCFKISAHAPARRSEAQTVAWPLRKGAASKARSNGSRRGRRGWSAGTSQGGLLMSVIIALVRVGVGVGVGVKVGVRVRVRVRVRARVRVRVRVSRTSATQALAVVPSSKTTRASPG